VSSRELVFLFLVVVCGTGGELCVTRAMKTLGEMHEFHPSAIFKFLARAVRVGWMWAGISMMALAFFSLLGLLSLENVSYVVPVTALSYAAGALGAAIFLRERVTPQRWLGVLVVCLGVTIVLLSKH
jgi:drug/metabolite transporter (DMT)-like permease